jgi:hypothetical protein
MYSTLLSGGGSSAGSLDSGERNKDAVMDFTEHQSGGSDHRFASFYGCGVEVSCRSKYFVCWMLFMGKIHTEVFLIGHV